MSVVLDRMHACLILKLPPYKRRYLSRADLTPAGLRPRKCLVDVAARHATASLRTRSCGAGRLPVCPGWPGQQGHPQVCVSWCGCLVCSRRTRAVVWAGVGRWQSIYRMLTGSQLVVVLVLLQRHVLA